MNLTIGWLYPDLMSTYGDRGNIIVLQKRAVLRGINTEVIPLKVGFDEKELKKTDLLFMGGAQDRQQEIVAKDLRKKSLIIKEMVEDNLPGLFICGAYQFLGNYYKDSDGSIIKGLEILDIHTINPGNDKRLIGNIAIKSLGHTLIGFENHGGRTYLGNKVKPFGEVLVGFGNNGEDKTEGTIYKNSFCTYLHGPILPKNPELADLLLKLALERKYKKEIELKPLDNSLEKQARSVIAQRLGIKV
ncbi:cobalamin biosynthesis protein CobQ [Patescibacteria group bacterium]|nr:cobalamin biosynthesis protein CobQ [Patescibacteria group bacterium]